MNNLIIDEEFDKLPDEIKGKLILNSNSVTFRTRSSGGIREYMKSQIADPVIVPEKITKEMLENLLKDRPKRNHYYPPNTPEMEAIMLRMIEELPDGTYRIKI